MKKFLILATLFLAAPTFATTDDFACENDILQPAVSPRGTCHVFETRCEVPNSWKIVSDCENVENPNFGANPNDVANRRLSNNYWEKYKAKIEAKKDVDTDTKAKRFGSASLGRGGSDRVSTGAIAKKRNTRTTSSTTYSPSNSFLLEDSRRDQTDVTESLKKRATSRGRTRLAIGSGAVREGKLQAKPKWSVTSSNRARRMEEKNTQGWRELTIDGRRVEKKEYEYEGIKLRKIYRPSSNGSIEKELIED
ncbi:hypothetical protein HOA64_02050 [bacterium]|jgi:hypothetical protein|nr:hypothetical protein [bacterium]MBT7772479.1 hypothetical protein [bacterium]